jgi:hypothetical protein
MGKQLKVEKNWLQHRLCTMARSRPTRRFDKLSDRLGPRRIAQNVIIDYKKKHKQQARASIRFDFDRIFGKVT